MAYRLSEDAGATVLVLEAGGWDVNPWIHIPLGWPRILLRRMNDWMYFSEPEPEIGGRPIYLRPALKRRNVTLIVNALTTRVLFEGHRASGVECIYGGRTSSVTATREVILCGGAINSPQILNLSGIGDPEELKAQGIVVRVPLKGVGKNLQDHISAAVSYLRKSPGPLHRAMRFDRIARELGNAYLHGTPPRGHPRGWIINLGKGQI